ncbi:hypothetical protein KAJ27_05895 [bacterium]|nr:hypothetical protein [bacterium]
MSINQAVVFTKPVHHLGKGLTPSILDKRARNYFEGKGFKVIFSKKVTGSDLKERDVIKQHYLMYSKAASSGSVSDLKISDIGMKSFNAAFGKSWDDEVTAGRVITTATLLKEKGIDVHQLFDLWIEQFAAGKTAKIQDGLLMAYLEELDCYCINAFYPAMEDNFNNTETLIDYYVLEFDSETVSWEQFRKNILGSTDASKADPESFRGQLYSEYKVDFPGRDNFVHGRAGPLEGFVERAIHEVEFNMVTNPIGEYLQGRGVTIDSFTGWKTSQSLSVIGEIFDATEEKNTDDIIDTLNGVKF